MTAQQTLQNIIRSREACSAEMLRPLYDQLEPATAEGMIGTWHGGKFDGGKEPNPINWYGKRFTSASEVDPMLCKKPDGTIYAWEDWGPAQLREVVFGGKVQACLIYDRLPLMDYFRKITDDMVLGLADMKGKPMDFFFWLERDKP
jgi:hypothetical protein